MKNGVETISSCMWLTLDFTNQVIWRIVEQIGIMFEYRCLISLICFNFHWWLIWDYACEHWFRELINSNHCGIEPSLVVGWFEVELMRNWGSCGRCCVRREPGFWITTIVWIEKPCMAYWVYSTKLCYEVYECAMCEPLTPSNVLRDTMWLILEILDVS